MGLYDDVKITSGEFEDSDYYYPKWHFLMLEAALKTRQPEYKVAQLAGSLLDMTTESLKKWPDHEEIKKWRQLATDIDQKVNKNAPNADWKEGFLASWDSSPAHGFWRTYSLAKGHAQAEAWTAAYNTCDDYLSLYDRESGENANSPWFFKEMLDSQKARFAEYAQELKKLKDEMAAKKK